MAPLVLGLTLDGVGGQLHDTATLLPVK